MKSWRLFILGDEYITGKFKKEIKNRFRCLVNINGVDEVCYVASSSNLSHFLDLTNKKVLLRKNKSKTNKTAFTLYAVNFDRTKILLELCKINKLISRYLLSTKCPNQLVGKIKMEYMFQNGYKADLFIQKQDLSVIIEAKAVLTYENIADFPSLYTNRALKQLSQLEELLKQGYTVYYWLVLLNPRCKDVSMNYRTTEFNELYKRCLELGMKQVVSTVVWKKSQGFSVHDFKPLILGDSMN